MTQNPYVIIICLLLVVWISWKCVDYFYNSTKDITNNISYSTVDVFLTLYICTGAYLLIYLFYHDLFLENINYIGILLGGQIAGLAVYKNIIHTLKMKEVEETSEKEKSKKVLNSYFLHMTTLAENQILFLNEMKKVIEENPSLNISSLGLDIYFFSDEINVITYLKPIDNMLNHDLHKYTNEDMINFILKIKVKTLENMHLTKLMKNDQLKNNKKEEFLKTVKYLEENTGSLIKEGQEYLLKK